ncbi:hypothetical protein [Altererythrobacter sp. MF3-039]|uniref:hypothetical protein n=1 Tax=Altererythrobacter sp. MF3-039 TaxID=3252901 RepID=UPI00390C4067
MADTSKSYAITIARHGFMVMLVGMIGGFAFAFALIDEVKLWPIPSALADSFPGNPDRWRAVHVGCLLNGIMAVAFAAVADRFAPTTRQAAWIKWGTVTTVWGNASFYIFALMAPNRGLSMDGNALGAGNLAGVISFTSGMVAAFALFAVIIIFLRCATTASKDEAS